MKPALTHSHWADVGGYTKHYYLAATCVFVKQSSRSFYIDPHFRKQGHSLYLRYRTILLISFCKINTTVLAFSAREPVKVLVRFMHILAQFLFKKTWRTLYLLRGHIIFYSFSLLQLSRVLSNAFAKGLPNLSKLHLALPRVVHKYRNINLFPF